jgi:hypothetical protein
VSTFGRVSDSGIAANRLAGLPIVVTGSSWHTANGLHVGAPLASLHRIFPRAYSIREDSG